MKYLLLLLSLSAHAEPWHPPEIYEEDGLVVNQGFFFGGDNQIDDSGNITSDGSVTLSLPHYDRLYEVYLAAKYHDQKRLNKALKDFK